MATALGASARAWTGSAEVAQRGTTGLQRQGRIPAHGSLRTGRCRGVVAMRVAQRTEPELYDGIANFYDESSGVWEEVWGEHMHHGYYDDEVVDDAVAAATNGAPDHRRAQIKMIEKSLAYAGVPDSIDARPKTIVDVGCGIGGSSRYLARKYKAKVNSITLSPVQVKRAVDITYKQGLAELVNFQVANALKQPFQDGSFDLVWSMESGEHMPDKKQFMGELARVAAPGGRIILVTWCHRDLLPGEKSLKPDEQELLNKICDAYYLPAWCSPSDYVTLAKDLGLQVSGFPVSFCISFWRQISHNHLIV
ncbi:hypothetical protein M758_3G073000 [Ceratodon purpureus]|uniref:Methyltransferase type 11 domain-containing protein n=1 Tax=Ceratodon purpureus TaxID=3225 RepID=A0A8T0IJ72_CERPU|nr:hypothetical protein KC19_3G072600 [Ceratodon purpureus]KAG0622111.1 hypothetical protein M758_3G073000 [Ceratodon purpureus]